MKSPAQQDYDYEYYEEDPEEAVDVKKNINKSSTNDSSGQIVN